MSLFYSFFCFSLELFLSLTSSKIHNRDKAEASPALKEEHHHLVMYCKPPLYLIFMIEV